MQQDRQFALQQQNTSTDMTRRQVLRLSSVLGLALAAGVIAPAEVSAAEWNGKAFEGKSLEEVVRALGGAKFTLSDQVSVNGPDIAENGAVVPVGVSSNAANTEFIAILVEKNPALLSAGFHIPAGTEPSVNTRIKMGTSSQVHALVKANGQWLVASKEIKVTLGGCGG